MFSALSHRNFRIFWAGAFLSNAGTWMQTVAQGWLVLQLTDSPYWLGVDAFMATLPGLLLTLLGGVYADLVDRKRLLILTQIGAGLTALTLATLMVTRVVSGPADVWIVLILSFVTGCCMALAGPSYQAITIDLVGREDLANAIALNSTQFQLSRVVGPVLAGGTMQVFGLTGCFFANGVSYVAIVAALASVRFPGKTSDGAAAVATGAVAGEAAKAETAPPPARDGRDSRVLWQDLLAGFRYVGGRPRVRLILLCSAVVSLFGAPYLVLAPVFARDVLGWGESGFSLLMGTAGAGAFCGALLITFLGDFGRKGRFMLLSSLAAAICLMGFLLAGRPAPALALLFCVGFSMVSFFAVANTLLQQLVTDEMRGRVMSMWILTFIGTMPFGSFIAGAAAERYGSPRTLAAGGLIIALFIASTAAVSKRLRDL
jgi:MFS family permease